MIYVKVHKGLSRVAAFCDEELLGKTLKDGKICLTVSEYFYGGDKRNKEEAKEIMKNSENINLVGKECVEIALDLKIIDKNSIIYIKGVPHAQAISC